MSGRHSSAPDSDEGGAQVEDSTCDDREWWVWCGMGMIVVTLFRARAQLYISAQISNGESLSLRVQVPGSRYIIRSSLKEVH
jgi:hypothetical protein